MQRDWQKFVYEQEEEDLQTLIKEERLKPDETRKFVANAFRDGEIRTTGTDIDKLMPPVSRFGGGRANRKQTIIDKLKAFFEKYFGLGITDFGEKKEPYVYEIPEPQLQMAAEEPAKYGKDNPSRYSGY